MMVYPGGRIAPRQTPHALAIMAECGGALAELSVAGTGPSVAGTGPSVAGSWVGRVWRVWIAPDGRTSAQYSWASRRRSWARWIARTALLTSTLLFAHT